MDALFAGVAIGYLFHFKPERFTAISRWYLPLLATLFLIPPFAGPENKYEISATMMGNVLGFSLFLIWAVPRRLRYCAWLGKLGKYSYSIHLWHQVVARLWEPLKHTSFLGLCGYVATSLIVGVAAARFIEAPSLAIREKIAPARRVRALIATARLKSYCDVTNPLAPTEGKPGVNFDANQHSGIASAKAISNTELAS